MLLAQIVAVILGLLGLGAAPPPPPVAPNYVALGDSYTSGPLIPAFEPVYGCLRSTNNYPHLLAPKLGLPLRDASCAGAESEDMTAPQGVTPGPNPPQYDRLDAGTQIVTFQIGGNDIGFSGIAEACFAPVPEGTPCQDEWVVDGEDQITQRINAAAPHVSAAVAGIATRAPNARVFVVGYPSIVPVVDDVLAVCWPQLPVSPGDIPWIRAKTQELNAMVAAAAAANGATYVDLYAASAGHDSCRAPGIRWVEPAAFVGPAAPLHPNLVGMLAMTDVVNAAIARELIAS